MIDHDFMFTSDKIAHRLALIEENLFQRELSLPAWQYHRLESAHHPHTALPAPDSPHWQIIEPHSYWGEWQTNFILKTDLVIPEDWPDSQDLQLYLPMGEAGDFFSHPEMLVMVDGHRLGAADRHHHILSLPAYLPKGRSLIIEAIGWTGLSSWPPEKGLRTQLYMRPCALVQRHEGAFSFLHTARSTLETAQLARTDKRVRHQLLDVLNEAVLQVDLADPIGQPPYFESLALAHALLITRLKDHSEAEAESSTIHAIGHAHIDIAYLWQMEQTRGKLRRSFANVLALMARDEDFCFTQTTPLLYQMCQQDDSSLFEDIKKRIDEGRWEAACAMWVESDCNLAGAESLGRQLTLARDYNDKYLEGRDSRVLFLPDTFGFCATLPQLVSQAGIDFFVFSKLNWNQTNPFPHSFFDWEGIDGTKLFSHLLTTPRDVAYLPMPSTYKAEMTAKEVAGSYDRCRTSDMPVMIAYGYGDGGGGPNDILLANARAYQHMPSQPRLQFGRLDQFMRAARQSAKTVPVHKGELYLELHRGTYTSQAKIKRANRELEAKLLETETLLALASWHKGANYPADKLTKLWQLYCTNQFHDILPGSAITAVFDDAMADYKVISQGLDTLFDESLTHFQTHPAHADAILPDRFMRLQTAPFVGCDEVASPNSASFRTAASQLNFIEKDDHFLLENAYISAVVDKDGFLCSYRHHQFGEMLIEGQKGNQLIAFEDRPLMWDAWDIDPFFEEKQEVITTSAKIEKQKVAAEEIILKIERRWRHSHITQYICLSHDSARLDFKTEIDWHEKHILLKAVFPIAVQANKARYHIPFGWIERATTKDNSHSHAQFEVSAHYWADISDNQKALALLNDCKYGYDITRINDGNQLRLSLIKSATLPDPEADQDMHFFGYSLLAHEAGQLEDVWQHGYQLNRPPRLIGAGYDLPSSLLPFDNLEGLFIEAVMWSKQGDGLAVRLYEPMGKGGQYSFTLTDNQQTVYLSNIIETSRTPLSSDKGRVTISCRPFEVLTLIFPKQDIVQA